MSTLGSYNIAVGGLGVAKRGLGVTSHNLSNVSTVGYTRQQSMQKDTFYRDIGTGAQALQLGTGVDPQMVRQIRDQFLDLAYRKEVVAYGYYDIKQKTLSEVQAVFGEPNGQGLQKVMNDFYNAWHEVAKTPDSLAARGLLKTRAMEFCDTVNQIQTQLEKKQDNLNLEMSHNIDKINNITKQVTHLNNQIMKYEATGDNANDLRDQRNLLLDELSTIVKVDISENQNKTVTVLLGGSALITGTERAEIIKKQVTDVNGESGPFIYPAWKHSESIIDPKNGALKAILEMRGYNGVTGAMDQDLNGGLTGKSPEEITDAHGFIPKIKKQLNLLVNTMAEGINNAMTKFKAIAKDSATNTPLDGIPMFSPIKGSVITAGNIRFNPEIDDMDKIAVSVSGAVGDGSGAEKILALRRQNDTVTFKQNHETYDFSYDGFYQHIVVGIGTVGQQAENGVQGQRLLINQLEEERTKLHGVSLDEEMSNMLTYQHAYNAASRVFTAIDEMVDKIINNLKR